MFSRFFAQSAGKKPQRLKLRFLLDCLFGSLIA